MKTGTENCHTDLLESNDSRARERENSRNFSKLLENFRFFEISSFRRNRQNRRNRLFAGTMLSGTLLAGTLILAGCGDEETDLVNGYVEGEFVFVAPRTAGILDEICVKKGDFVAAGTKLFALDNEIWAANLQSAQSELDRAIANFTNLTKGQRKEELEIIIRQRAQAIATLENAEKEFHRYENLVAKNSVREADFDAKKADFKLARERVSELDATLLAATLSAREDELKAAQAEIEIAQQNLAKTRKQAADCVPAARLAGQVDDVYFRLGEFVPAGTPVVSILPPENVKVRFFVSEKAFPRLKMNQPVSVIFDGGKAEIPAKISFLSTKSEFTPPVIYSTESREKLVFMVEAAFDDLQQNLPPGTPVSVRIAGTTGTEK